MTPNDAKPLINALRPILSRVRTEVTALKGKNGIVAWRHREALTPERMAQHLNGGPARGVSPIKAGENVTMLGLFDFDSHKGQTTWEQMVDAAQRLASELQSRLLEPIAFRSSGGHGIHIFLLWDEPQDAYSVRAEMADALTAIGLKSGVKGVSNGQVEVFPKQAGVAEGKYGNMFVLPMAGKSAPLDLLFGETTGTAGLLSMEWPSSMPVVVRERPPAVANGVAGDVSIATLRAALAQITNDGVTLDKDGKPLSPDYDEWVRIIFSIHSATGGSNDGLELAVEFSARNPLAHNERFLRERVWPYADSNRDGGRTHLSILAEARKQSEARGAVWQQPHELDFTDESGEGVQLDAADAVTYGQHAPPVLAVDIFTETEEQKKQARYEARNKWREVIGQADDEFKLREAICVNIGKDLALGPAEREQLADQLTRKFKDLGAKLPIATIRKLIEPRTLKKTTDNEHIPKWAQGWVYVNDEDKFFKLGTNKWLTAQGWRANFNPHSTVYSEDGQPDAYKDAINNSLVQPVDSSMYLPWAGPIFEEDEHKWANTYRPNSVPKPADKISPRGLEAVAAVRRHMELLFNARSEVVETIMCWMAHNVQHPGVKIRWAPLVKGVQGDGKTILGMLMTAVLGRPNVKQVSPHALASPFTSWGEGSCIAVLEEVRIIGHNRYDIFNALKPYITNDDVPIVGKGADEKQTRNVTNYMGFTNFNDAMPMDDGDRRWMVIFSPFKNIGELAAAVGGDTGAYFDKLFDLIQTQRADLRRFFLDYPIAASFKPNGKAPHTAEREMMISLAMNDDEAALREVLEGGGIGISANVLASSYVSAALQVSGADTVFQTSALSKALTKMGWAKIPQRIRWNGKPEWVWVRSFLVHGQLGTDGIRAELDLTAAGQEVDLFAGFDEVAVPSSPDSLFN